ncbi:60S ribosomal protein L24-like [Populus alba x Populus x berolinensis]|nr:60S ribosomal protein L24-like [Populus alba x Populus x berolinensis]
MELHEKNLLKGVTTYIIVEAVKKKRRTFKKPYSRSIVGATLKFIQKRRAEKPEVCDVALWHALSLFISCDVEIKERIKKTRHEKKTEKVELMAETQKTQSKDRPQGAAPKGPKLGGGGGG